VIAPESVAVTVQIISIGQLEPVIGVGGFKNIAPSILYGPPSVTEAVISTGGANV
jgi:hypothetical protein